MEAVASEHLRLSGVYWGLACCALLRAPADALGDAKALAAWVRSCGVRSGASGKALGFAPAPGHDAHLLYTLSALQVLALLGELGDVDADAVAAYVAGTSANEKGLTMTPRSDPRFAHESQGCSGLTAASLATRRARLTRGSATARWRRARCCAACLLWTCRAPQPSSAPAQTSTAASAPRPAASHTPARSSLRSVRPSLDNAQRKSRLTRLLSASAQARLRLLASCRRAPPPTGWARGWRRGSWRAAGCAAAPRKRPTSATPGGSSPRSPCCAEPAGCADQRCAPSSCAARTAVRAESATDPMTKPTSSTPSSALRAWR